ncbi:MAG: response regulator transcription factor [Rhodoferax sp.]|nr:response regulator transcription factor [Rhodoferax sp.]
MPYKILIVDDHPLMREGLAAVINALPGGAEVFVAGNAVEALEQAEFHTPLDLVLLDFGLPDAEGCNLIQALRTRSCGAPVIVVSAEEDPLIAQRALALGAHSFIPKSQSATTILQAAKLALTQGNTSARHAPMPEPINPAAPTPVLTARQLDILLMLDQGMTNLDIGLRLGLAEKTVKNHITGLFAALGSVNRLQSIRRARDLGLLV